jgi:hypothetical protein
LSIGDGSGSGVPGLGAIGPLVEVMGIGTFIG